MLYSPFQIARECRSELKRIMNIRGQSIGLLPEIEDNCIQDLATCKGTDVKGEVKGREERPHRKIYSTRLGTEMLAREVR